MPYLGGMVWYALQALKYPTIPYLAAGSEQINTTCKSLILQQKRS